MNLLAAPRRESLVLRCAELKDQVVGNPPINLLQFRGRFVCPGFVGRGISRFVAVKDTEPNTGVFRPQIDPSPNNPGGKLMLPPGL